METEIWKDVVGYEDRYRVSNFGNLYSKRYKRIKKVHLNRDGYLYSNFTVNFISSTKKVHKIVADAFLPLIEGKNHIDHIDGDKQNNNASNLRRCTHAENIAFGWETGAYNNIGSNHGNAKLNENIVKDIKIKLTTGETLNSLAKQYNVSSSTILNIKKGKIWKHVLLSA